MYAVLFQVDIKKDWHGDADAELDELARTTKELPGFVRATWASNDTRGAGFIVVETEDVARGIADNPVIPPEASVTFRSVDVLEVKRDV
jgi:hypothetical protein